MTVPASLRPKLGPVSLGFLTLAALLFLAAIWTSDDRWAQSAAIFLIPGIVLAIIYGCIRLENSLDPRRK